MNNNVSLKLLGIVIFQALLCSLCQSQSDEVNRRCVSPSCKDARETGVDRELKRLLRESGFTGKIESTLEQRLGRRLDPRLADLGRLLWFDVAGGLHSDNTCGGCHSPTNGMGDTQSIAIGIQNNGVGRNAPNRTAESATHACSSQRSLLPSTDVEWALLIQLGRSVR